MARVFVPNDTSACSLGAEAVAAAVESALAVSRIDACVVRNGSRGAYALEPLLEVESTDGRIGFPRVEAKHVAALFAAGIPGRSHASCIGVVDNCRFCNARRALRSHAPA
jgi:formate dehydrogenase iron-sulfur subunit